MSAVIYPLHRSQPAPSRRARSSKLSGIHGQVHSQTSPAHDPGSARPVSHGAAEPAGTRTPVARAIEVPRLKSWSVDVVETVAAIGVAVVAPLAATAVLAAAVGLGLAPTEWLGESFRALPLLSLLLVLLGGQRLVDRGATLARAASRSTIAASLAAVGLVVLTLILTESPGFIAIGVALIVVAPLCGLIARLAMGSDAVARRLRRNVAVFGSDPAALAIIAAIERDPGCRLAGVFDQRQDQKRRKELGPDIDGTLDDLVGLVARGLVDEVVLVLPPMATARTQQICDRFRELPVDVLAPDHTVLPPGQAEDGERIPFAGETMTRIHRRPITGWGALAKSVFDRLVAGLALLVLAPVLAAVALAIKLDSKGPVFFRQRRHGMCGQTIVVWKFRTMRVMEDGAVVRQASQSDDRVTRVGRILRRTSLDELPQLLNVLDGSMSIVGPRPHAIAHDEHYGALLPTYARRSIIRPGITGWAQVNGLRGETRTPAEMAARVRHDLWYVANWSFWLDLRIILLTPIYGLVHKNAY